MAQGEETSSDNWLSDFTYDRNVVREREPMAYPKLREADVMYRRRIHRVIDSREKQNMVMNWPKSHLGKLLYKAVTEGINGQRIPAYVNDSLYTQYTIEEVLKLGGTETVIPIYDEYGTFLYDSIIKESYRPTDIVKYEIVEDWIFDKQSGQYFPRIIGIAPYYKPVAQGVDLGEQALFWVNYRDLRKIIVNHQLFNRHNDAMRLTYYDFFELRFFSSYAVKEPNEFDYYIKNFPEYKDDPYAALIKSETIKEELFNWEHDLWEY